MKKILIFSDPQADYLSYMTHHGFTKLIGGFNVITYPFKRSHHGMVDDDYILDDGKKGFTAPGQNMERLRGRLYVKYEIDQLFQDKQIQFCILQSARTYAVNALIEFAEIIHEYKVPVIFIDGEDGTNIRWDIIDSFKHLKLIHFKRELLKDFKNQHPEIPIYPLPFSSTIDLLKTPDKQIKDIDAFCSFGMTHEKRKNVVTLIRNDPRLKSYKIVCNTDKERLSYDQYIDCMSRAKINIICRGHGYDTVRKWEAATFSGLMLSDKIPIKIPFDFERGTHISHYRDNLSDLADKIIHYLENDDDRIAIGKAGQKHCIEYHTSDKHAELIYNAVQMIKNRKGN